MRRALLVLLAGSVAVAAAACEASQPPAPGAPVEAEGSRTDAAGSLAQADGSPAAAEGSPTAAEGSPAAAEGSPAEAGSTAVAIFAGGCFWCMEAPFDELEGVLSTTSGYTGGQLDAPSYQQVSSGTTGHVEAVRVRYDPEKVDYARLLEVFWHNVDPLDDGGQFCDRGPQYRSAIFVRDAEQRRLAEASRQELTDSGGLDGPIATEIRDAGPFHPAEGYHQDYYRKNPIRYRFYRSGCGRDGRLEEVWGEQAGH